MKDLFDFITNNISKTKISGKNKQLILEEVNKLRSFIVDARPARIAIVGRRGAGKSSLINAILGEERAQVGHTKAQTGIGTWYEFESELGSIDILDTRGLGETSLPEEEVKAKTPLEEIKKSVKEKCPDVILFLSKAKEVDARIEEDLQQLQQLRDIIKQTHYYDIPVVGIVTQVDELAPLSNIEPPFDHPEKQANINETVSILTKRLSEQILKPVKVIPVAAYMEFENGHLVYDRRWNIDQLIDFLLTELPQEAQIILAKLAKINSVQKKLARKISKSVMGITGLIGASPIPIADMPVITGLQISLVGSIAVIGGQTFTRKSIIQFIGAMGLNVGAGLALREVARQLAKIIPGAGNLVSGAVATAGTYAISEAAITYYIDRKSEEEAKQVFDEQIKQHQKSSEK